MEKKIKRRRMHRIFWAAKTALTEPGGVRLTQWIGRGPSIRARARLALAAAFLVAAPILFIGVLRTANIADYSSRYGKYDAFSRRVRSVMVKSYGVDLDIWRFLAQPEKENERSLKSEYIQLASDVERLVIDHPPEFDFIIGEKILATANQVDFSIEHAMTEHGGSARTTHLLLAQRSLSTLTVELHRIDDAIATYGGEQMARIQKNLSQIGRDQLILFLILLFAIPVFVGLVPGWLVAPIYRLKGMARKIEEGRLREISVTGRDEISSLTKSLKRALLWRESLEQKKSAKIFELRNVLRSVLSRSSECILIIDSDSRINYTNRTMAALIGTEPHSLEGDKLTNFLIAPQLFSAIEKALKGDVSEAPMPMNFELGNGTVFSLEVVLGAVHDRDGSISRVVVILRPDRPA